MSFIKTISNSRLFYRSAHTVADLPGYWYCLIANDTFGYGPITGEFKPIRDLRLIDITSQEFYNDFILKLKEISEINPSINSIKHNILFPIGFPNIEVYYKYAEYLRIARTSSSHELLIEIESQFFGDRSRHSIKEYDIDFLKFIEIIYINSDGIIASQKLPNRILNGFHHPEIAVYDKKLLEFLKDIPRSISGGNNQPKMLTAVMNHKDSEIERTTTIIDNYLRKKDKTHNIFENYQPKMLTAVMNHKDPEIERSTFILNEYLNIQNAQMNDRTDEIKRKTSRKTRKFTAKRGSYDPGRSPV